MISEFDFMSNDFYIVCFTITGATSKDSLTRIKQNDNHEYLLTP